LGLEADSCTIDPSNIPTGEGTITAQFSNGLPFTDTEGSDTEVFAELDFVSISTGRLVMAANPPIDATPGEGIINPLFYDVTP
jgi:hypothetical protein